MYQGRVFSFARNLSCGLLGCGLILSGRVRKGLKRAFEDGAVTPIYFHNPNRQLFEGCVKWLIKHNFQFISTAQLIDIFYNGTPAPKGAVWLSMDDGFRELIRNVFPVIKKYNVPVTLFVPTGIIEGKGLFPWLEGHHRGDRDAMTEFEVKEVASFPEITLGGHTVGHLVTAGLTAQQLSFELDESKRTLEQWSGSAVESFAYPEGRFDGRERNYLAELNYKLAATTEPALVKPGTDPLLVPRFCVGDDVWMPEAICNMAGEWTSVINWIKARLHNWGSSTPPSLPRSQTQVTH